ncbi:hypothetical protein QE152_g30274 [Popillia japonica]|uniref:Integrase catalytic domain-containing protein n=1 Tax=Popillia japonica TaxID=7064 RepID=A0AAW1JEB6_POPJA
MPINSIEFKTFANDWDFDLLTSSPQYPKSNGLAERAVGICKNIVRKCLDDNSDIYKALLEYRTSPLTGLNLSPAELLNNRLLRTILPISTETLKSRPEIDLQKIQKQRQKAKTYYDRQSQQRNDFHEGDSVMLRKERIWVPAEIIVKAKIPRSYLVKDNIGRVYRRNMGTGRNYSQSKNPTFIFS